MSKPSITIKTEELEYDSMSDREKKIYDAAYQQGRIDTSYGYKLPLLALIAIVIAITIISKLNTAPC